MGAFAQGLTLGLAYVAPIGMQNLFVIDAALTKPRRRAMLTAFIVLCFDISLSLACFFGIGRLMQEYEWMRLGVLALGGVVVICIGAGLLFPRGASANGRGDARTPQSTAERHSSRSQATATARQTRGGELLHTILAACAVTWCNPQGIIDGTLMLGAFSVTLTFSQSVPFITGVGTASALWFTGLTLLVSGFSHRFNAKAITTLNRVCGVVVMAYGIKLLVDFAGAIV